MKNEIVIVTGSSSGIGNAITKLLESTGYLVIGIDKFPPIKPDNPDYFIKLDLNHFCMNEEEHHSLYQEVEGYITSKHAKLVGLVNCAAVQLLGDLECLQLADFDTTLNVNLKAPLILTKLFYTQLKKTKGSVVNIGSVHAKLTKPRFIAYATSKAAIEGLTKALAMDCGGNIRVNCIHPAAINTKMLMNSFDGSKEKLDKLKKCHPVKRIGESIEVAHLVLYLLTEKSSFITGSRFEISGGIAHRLHDPE